MNAWSTACSECGWEGSVRVHDAIRGCPRRNPNGGRCGAPFATNPPAPTGTLPFTRPMTEGERGELVLLREYLGIKGGWVRDDEGRVLRYRPRPASWDTAEGEAKTQALWDILGTDPFPVPEGKTVRLDAGVGLEAMGAEAKPPRKKREEQAVPVEPFRKAERARAREPAKALEESAEMDQEQWLSLVASEPPGK